MNEFDNANRLLTEQLGHDVIIALGTINGNSVNLRNVDGYYKDGIFYVMTYAASQKMKDISENPNVAICKDLFSGHGIGENLGSPLQNDYKDLRDELKDIFKLFYEAHVNEKDPLTCILKITLTDAYAFSKDTKYIIDFKNKKATAIPCIVDIKV